jgi:glycosyltransferase involved in cell wall biosynthesis
MATEVDTAAAAPGQHGAPGWAEGGGSLDGALLAAPEAALLEHPGARRQGRLLSHGLCQDGDNTRLLVWQWGRYGGGPRTAVNFAAGFDAIEGMEAILSLSTAAEIMLAGHWPGRVLPVDTYTGRLGYIGRVLRSPVFLPALERRIRALSPRLALCAMPGPLDLLMHAALTRLRIPYAVVVHDADLHPGDGFMLQMGLQRALVRRCDAIVTLSEHVRARLEAQGLTAGKPVLAAQLPEFGLAGLPPPRAHGGKLRVLSFGRLLPYKGLGLLAESLSRLLPRDDIEVRIVGKGPDSAALQALRLMRDVTVENGWVPEAEVAGLLAWADVVVLSHTEASQSGVAAAAISAGRWVVATRVGGLVEQASMAPNAWLCDPDPASLASALQEVLRCAAEPAGGQGRAQEWQNPVTRLAADLLDALPARRKQKTLIRFGHGLSG